MKIKNVIVAGVLISSISLAPSWIKNVDDYALWISEFTYQAEVLEDNWKTPKETIRDKGGDCEDFAILAVEVLKKLDYKVYLIGIELEREGELKGHAIALLKHDNG